jgi:hypothetical protein
MELLSHDDEETVGAMPPKQRDRYRDAALDAEQDADLAEPRQAGDRQQGEGPPPCAASEGRGGTSGLPRSHPPTECKSIQAEQQNKSTRTAAWLAACSENWCSNGIKDCLFCLNNY